MSKQHSVQQGALGEEEEEEEPEGTSSESRFWDSGSRLATQLPHLPEAQ